MIMDKLGFSTNWISKVMSYISSVSYSFLVNGTSFGALTLTRGLRQCDPLFLYIFLICVEGLSSIIRRAESLGHISGLKCGVRKPSISHLFFADDIFSLPKLL